MQVEALEALGRARGWTTERYIDQVSGATHSRPALDRLLNDVQRGKVQAVAVWKLDRLGRSLSHVLTVLDTFDKAGVAFVSLHDAGVDTSSPTGKLFTAIVGAFAEFERELIRERVVAGVRSAQAKGVHCGRPTVETEDQALDAARQLLASGWSWRDVAKATGLNKDTLRRRLAA